MALAEAVNTCSDTLPCTLFAEMAITFTSPSLTACTIPVGLTVATAGLEVLQVKVVGAMLPLASLACAVYCRLSPGCSMMNDGDTVTEAGSPGATYGEL